ncbi:hypothetical protein J4G33_14705 [Actinotalea sp. BY-33]|uniref:Tight adherence protein B n=1 Tax=Actinotalea soli TaxID=2819234 RepID=A0A939LUR0_9CELL|nr:hypothetical protein [Actinotalea soli]MBO1753060.1 hypothetical protein [Actinotalea soli]
MAPGSGEVAAAVRTGAARDPASWRARLRGAVRAEAAGGTFGEVVAQVCGALRAGAPPTTAWHRVGVRALDGVPVREDLLDAGLTSEQGLAVTAACRVAGEVGAAPAPVLERVMAAVAHEAEAAGQREAALAGPRATARLLAWLPVLGLVLGAALGAEPWAVLLDGGLGTVLLVAGAGLMLVGHRWAGRYVRTATAAGQEPGRGSR